MANAPRGPKSDKVWSDAIRLAVHRYHEEKDENGKVKKVRYLNLLADNLVDAGIKGDVSALKEIGDRLDGKSAQAVNLDAKVEVKAVEWVVAGEPKTKD